MKTKIFKPEFVDYIPGNKKNGMLYVSMKYRLAVHLCPCGCGEVVVTPFDKDKGWIISFDGEHITLTPSIGNFDYKCQSHYWIKENRVITLYTKKQKK